MILFYSFSTSICIPELYSENIIVNAFSSKVIKPVFHETSKVIMPVFSSRVNLILPINGVHVTNNFALSITPFKLQGKDFDFYPTFGKIIRRK